MPLSGAKSAGDVVMVADFDACSPDLFRLPFAVTLASKAYVRGPRRVGDKLANWAEEFFSRSLRRSALATTMRELRLALASGALVSL